MKAEEEPMVMGMEAVRRDVTARSFWRVGSGRSWNWRVGGGREEVGEELVVVVVGVWVGFCGSEYLWERLEDASFMGPAYRRRWL